MSLPATQRLYYHDAHLVQFDGNVVELDASRTRLVLDQSAFYPTSGGQPFDTGTLAGIAVVDVTEDGDTVVHHLAAPLPSDVTTVPGQVDWVRRFDHMQQHSGQHLLSAVLEDQCGCATISVHFGAESCTLDLATDTLTPEAIRTAERAANALVAENRAITVSFEQSTTATGLRKPSDRDGVLRIVTIEGIDINACGGTHVAHTGQIGAVLLRRTERVRGGTRLEFVCGARAINRARADFEIVRQLANGFSSSIDDLPTLVPALQAEAQAANKERMRLVESLAVHEAQALYRASTPDAHGRRLHRETLADASAKSRQHIAQQYALQEQALFLAVSHAPPAVLLAASADTGLDCGQVLKDALAVVGGRGGGTPRMAQGSAPTVEAASAAAEEIVHGLRSGVPTVP